MSEGTAKKGTGATTLGVALAVLAIAALVLALALYLALSRSGKEPEPRTAIPSRLPTTPADFFLPGSQPGEVGGFESSKNCASCHGGYNREVEPDFGWKGSMMGNAARDPIFYAALAVANQDAAGSGDLCIRCHSPTGWLEGRSTPADASALTSPDRESIKCDFCHRLTQPGITGSGMYVADPGGSKRGPYKETVAPHATIYTPWQQESSFCGTCHDVSNPLLGKDAQGNYLPNSFDAPAGDFSPASMFPVERTYSEWLNSDYARQGVFAPQFAGNKKGGLVSSCQDCHLPDAQGKACNFPSAGERSDLARHDLMGANTFAPQLIESAYGGEVDGEALAAGARRAGEMLGKAATLELQVDAGGGRATVKVINESGHKLPTGYAEGRRMWINLQAYDEEDNLIFESGAYENDSATLKPDVNLKLYQVVQGISPQFAPMAQLPAGPASHFILNNTIISDNRIPPRGFTNAAFTQAQAATVGYSYADGQYWDVTSYPLPPGVRRIEVKLYYQTISKEYIDFLRSENFSDDWGEKLFELWKKHGKSEPVEMAQTRLTIG